MATRQDDQVVARYEPARGAAAAGILMVAGWCALAAGLLEGLRHVIWRYGLDRLIWMSADVYWLAPLSYLTFFALPALALAALAWFRPRWVPLWLPALLFGALASFGLLMLLGRHKLALWAVMLLALGIGAHAARLVRARPSPVLRFVRRSGALMFAVFLLLVLLIPVGRPLRERLTLASLPDAPPSALNVLLIILDTVRGENLSVYGYDRPTTPNLERLGREGVVFEDAIAPAPWTLTSHASFFTGRWPHELSADRQLPLDRAHLTLAESFRARGYLTAGFTANLIYTGRESGLDRGFNHYREHKRSLRQLLLSSYLGQTIQALRSKYTGYIPLSDRKVSPEVRREFLDWLNGVADRPFLAFLNYFDAHLPYYAPEPFHQPYRSDNNRLDRYDAAISYLDHELGTLFAELRRRGVLDNTVVVVTSDHGEAFGEHGLWAHGNSLYEVELHVPLIIWHPATVPAGIRVPGFVSLRNLPATLTDLTGGPVDFPGSSLAALWSARDSARWGARNPVLAEVSAGIRADPHEPVSKGPLTSLFTEPHHLIRNGDGREELYDLRRDPRELLDLARTRQGQRMLPRLGFALDAYLSGRSAHAAAPGQ